MYVYIYIYLHIYIYFHYRQGLKLDPEHKACKASYRKIKQMENIAKAAEEEVRSGQLNEALKSYEKGAKIDPQQQLFAGLNNICMDI